MMASLTDLYWELLMLILQNLTIPDNFRLVHCLKTWLEKFKEQPVPSTVQTPWLLVHPHPDDKQPKISALFDLSQAKMIRLPVPLPSFSERICVGSTGGWMVTITRGTLEAHLLNPISGRQIDLPRFRHISAAELNEEEEDLNFSDVNKTDDYFAELLVENTDNYFRYSKAVISWDNGEGNGEVAFTVVIILYFRGCTVVARGQQPDWLVLRPPQFYEDVMVDAKGKKLFLLDTLIHRQVDICSLSHQDPLSSLGHLSLQMPQEQDHRLRYLAGWFFKEVSEIFILERRIPPGFRPDASLEVGEALFRVFKYYSNVGHFEEVHDLGGKSIFVGASNAIVLSLPGPRRNSVYYFDGSNYPNNVCIYDMEERRFLTIPTGVPLRDVQRLDAVGLDALWLSPSFR